MTTQAEALIPVKNDFAVNASQPSLRLVEKAFEAIQINVVVGELSLLQRKILNILLENAKARLAQIEVHEIPFAEIVARLNYNSNDHKPIRSALDGLPSRQIRWNYLNPGTEKDYGVSAYISEVKYVGNKVRYAYPPTVREILHSPRRYAVLNLAVQNAFNQKYSLPLYELCKQSLDLGETPVYSVSQWRELLGVPKGTVYDEFKHLRQKVFNPAVDEINGSSDVKAEPVFHREGRHIVALSFTVSSNPQLPLQLASRPTRGRELVERMMALGFKETLARQYLTRYPEEYLVGNIEVVEEKQRKGQLKSNPAGYLAKAIESDYRPVETAAVKAKREESERIQLAREESERKREGFRRLSEQFNSARDDAIRQAIEGLDADARTALEEDFLEEVARTNPLVARQFRRSGLRSMIVKTSFQEFAATRLGFGDKGALFSQFLSSQGHDPNDFKQFLNDSDTVSTFVQAAA
jgi:hypothetical protein